MSFCNRAASSAERLPSNNSNNCHSCASLISNWFMGFDLDEVVWVANDFLQGLAASKDVDFYLGCIEAGDFTNFIVAVAFVIAEQDDRSLDVADALQGFFYHFHRPCVFVVRF